MRNSVCPVTDLKGAANVNFRSKADPLKLHSEYLAQQEAAALRLNLRWRAAGRIALSILLAGAILQLYMLHVYATIAALPTLGLTVPQ